MPLTNPQLLVDRAAHKRRRTLVVLALSNVLVAVLLAALVHAGLSASRASHAAQARSVVEGMTAIAQANVGSELDKIDAVLRASAGEVRRLQAVPDTDPARIQQALEDNFALLSGVESLRFADASGQVRHGNKLPPGAPMDVSDRPYFHQARQHDGDRTLVAGPLESRISGHWVLVFVRPLVLDGEFKGIVYASVAASHFGELFERYDLAPMDAMTLRLTDLRLLARRSPGSAVQGQVGSTQVSAELRAELASNPASGVYVSRVAVDGVERTTAYRALEKWPFVVFAGVASDRFFAPWKRQAWTVSGLAVLCWLLVAMATAIVYRASLREAVAMQALAAQTRHTRALLHVAGDGIHIVDRTGHLIEMSDSFAEMLHSTRERLLGRPVWSWDANQDEAQIKAWLARVRDGDKQRVDVQHRRDDGAVIDVELQMRVSDVDGELVVFGSGRDVTEQKRLQREQAAMLDSDLVGMFRVENRIILWRNRAFERLFAYEPGELAGQPVRLLHDSDETYERLGREAYPVMAEGREYRTRIRMRRKTGEPLWIDLGGVRLTETQSLFMAVDVTATVEAQDGLRHAAFHDPLTQLPNRLLLADRLQQNLATAARDGTRVAVAYLDLDGFKAVNDSLGHDAGDALLIEVAARLKQNLRPSDTAARLGGDEFVVVLTGLRGDEWRPVLERVVDAVSRVIPLPSGASVSVGATAGVAVSTPDVVAEELLARADARMLAGKRSGKGRVFAEG